MKPFEETRTVTAPNPAPVAYSSIPEVAAAVPTDRRILWLVDKDGTLDKKIPDADRAFVPVETSLSLYRIASTPNNQITLVSGRQDRELQRLVGPLVFHPSVTSVASYGLTRRRGNEAAPVFANGMDPQSFLERLRATKATIDQDLTAFGLPVKQQFSDERGLFVNIKQDAGAIEIHYRAALEFSGPAVSIFTTQVQPYVSAGTHELNFGDCVVELKLKGSRKTDVVRQEIVLHQPDFVVVLGDDKADLAAMRVAAELLGERSVGILVGDLPLDELGGATNSSLLFRVESPSEVAGLMDVLIRKFGSPGIDPFESLTAHSDYRAWVESVVKA